MTARARIRALQQLGKAPEPGIQLKAFVSSSGYLPKTSLDKYVSRSCPNRSSGF